MLQKEEFYFYRVKFKANVKC